mmetsp:Transcript_16773/g.50378  ORF Transcript_16773/g.50378 Transcript_16773/m.50378 type:complete len:303 (+) Transcript_16773:884-1792(+)
MEVKSFTSENMIVTRLRSTCSLAARFSPLTMFRTTVSGTNLVNASMPRSKLQNSCCSVATSTMRDRLSPTSASSRSRMLANWSLLSLRMSSLSCTSGSMTRLMKAVLAQKLSSPMTTNQKMLNVPSLCASKFRVSSCTSTSWKNSLLFCLAAWVKAPTGITMTSSQRVWLRKRMESIPMWRHPPLCMMSSQVMAGLAKGESHTSKPPVLFSLMERKSGPGSTSVSTSGPAVHEPKYHRMALAANLVTLCSESTAMSRPCLDWRSTEASVNPSDVPIRSPSCSGYRCESWLMIMTVEVASSKL